MKSEQSLSTEKRPVVVEINTLLEIIEGRVAELEGQNHQPLN